ncbi:MAG TPA: PAS domain S-box protein [Polyangium sp.]|nr:PAS domain S-box protein [Polyangium sp.]
MAKIDEISRLNAEMAILRSRLNETDQALASALETISTLRASEQRMSVECEIARVVPGVLYLYDVVEGKNLYANLLAQEILGYSPAEIDAMQGRIFPRRIHPDDLGDCLAHFARLQQMPDGHTATIEYRVQHKDGSWRWFSSRNTVFERDGRGRALKVLGVASDVTERKVGEQRLDLAMKAGNLGLWDVDVRTGNAVYGGQWPGLLGYASGEFVPHIDTWKSVVHPDDLPLVLGALTDHLEGRAEYFQYEYRMRRKDGTWRWIADRGLVVERDPEGKALRVIGMLTDDTERKQAADDVDRQRRLLSAVLDAVPVCVVIADREGRIVRANAACEEIWGTVPDTPHWEAYGDWVGYWPDTGRRIQAHEWGMARALLKGETVRAELVESERFDTHERRFFLNHAAPVRDADGTVIGAVVVAVDVTQHRAAEKALKENEERFRALFEAMPLSAYLIDPDTLQVVDCNETAASALGYTRDELRSLRIPDFDAQLLAPEVVELSRRAFDGEPLMLETLHKMKSGELRDVVVMVRSVRVGNRKLNYATALDVTERKRAEAALRDTDRRKDEFLAMLAHELRNPLAPIRNAVQLLHRVDPQDPALARARDIIERQVDHLVRLVDDLLDVSRVSRGKITLQRARIDLADVVRNAVEATTTSIASRRHTLTTTLPSEPIYVDGDSTRLAQVVCNLLNNAAKYTDDGGRIAVSLERAGTPDKPQAIVRVKDDGRGIDPQALGNLFQLFYQVDRTLDRSEGGLGIGLALVKSIVELHGGTIEAHSAGRGQGSEFLFRLPAQSERQTAQGFKGTPAGCEIAPRLRLLVVDDNRDAAESMALLLQLEGHDAIVLYDGKQAVDKAIAERPDVILLDIGLPYLNGYDACRMMRAGGLKDTLIIALTGYGQQEDRRQSFEAGFDAHFVKPLALNDLCALLARRASGSHARTRP